MSDQPESALGIVTWIVLPTATLLWYHRFNAWFTFGFIAFTISLLISETATVEVVFSLIFSAIFGSWLTAICLLAGSPPAWKVAKSIVAILLAMGMVTGFSYDVENASNIQIILFVILYCLINGLIHLAITRLISKALSQ